MKERLDVSMAARGLAKSREHARALIMAGQVYVAGRKAEKAGEFLPDGAEITVRENPIPFVSRGGLKLQKALDEFPIVLSDAICADIGASTGGFTDCMLRHGAQRVYAIDVGYGQLDWTLRNDPRVCVMERTNARYMERGWFETPLDFASIDVSFISLDKILPSLYACLSARGQVVALIKPQFEAGRGKVGKHGVVSDAETHTEVCIRTVDVARTLGYSVMGLSFSPIRGPKGNIEYLLWLTKEACDSAVAEADTPALSRRIVESSHAICISQ